VGGAPAAALRGRPARVPDVPRRDARRGLHYAAVSDRSDPLPPPHARHDHGARRRRAESPIDPGARDPECATRAVVTGPRRAHPLTAPRSPRPTRRGRAACAVVRPQPRIAPSGADPVPRGRPTRRTTPPHGQSARGDPAVAGVQTPSTRTPARDILPTPRLKFLSCVISRITSGVEFHCTSTHLSHSR